LEPPRLGAHAGFAGGVRGRRLAAAAIDGLLLAAPWTALLGLMAYHGVWGGQLGGLGDVVTVVIGCLAGSVLLVVLEAATWLGAGRTLGMGLAGIAVVRGRPWLASLVVVALVLVLGAATTAAAVGGGSVNPQNAVALVLVLAKAVDLAFAMTGSGRTLVDRMSGLQVGLPTPSPRRRVVGGLTIDVALAVSIGAPLVLALTDIHDLVGAAMGAGGVILALLALQAATLTATGGTLGMRVLR